MAEIAPAGVTERTGAEAAETARVGGRPRDSELFLLVLALGTGVAAGVGVVLIDLLLSLLRQAAFGIPPDAHLSDIDLGPLARVDDAGAWRGPGGPPRRRCCGAGGSGRSWTRSRRMRCSAAGCRSATVWAWLPPLCFPAGFGASVGLEAAYTQLGAALASRLGRWAELRRDDVRTLVGCGAAGAIAAAFNAPLTGAFYAFELIIGAYTLQTLAPVGIAALTGALVVRGLGGSIPIFVVWHEITIPPSDYPAFFGVGLASAGLGILVMKGVTSTETLFRSLAVPRWARPAIGGLLIGAMALFFPQILGSGHGGIMQVLHSGFELPFLAGLIVAKIVASAVSIGSGFRGGLFSTSLFLGSLFGSCIGAVVTGSPRSSRRSVGLRARGNGFRRCGDRRCADNDDHDCPRDHRRFHRDNRGHGRRRHRSDRGAHWFGYSFATWRFHLARSGDPQPRGCGLDQRTADRPDDAPRSRRHRCQIAGRRNAPALSGRQHEGGFCRRRPRRPLRRGRSGRNRLPPVVDGKKTVGELVSKPAPFLLPGDNLRTALDRFSEAAQETLPVIDNPEDRRIIGYLSEAYALRRYAQELEQHRGGRLDDAGIFSPSASSAPPAGRQAQNR